MWTTRTRICHSERRRSGSDGKSRNLLFASRTGNLSPPSPKICHSEQDLSE